MAVTTTQTNKPLNPRGNDQSPKGYNRAELYSGKALDFDGVNDSVSVADSDDLDGFTNFTYSVIAKADSTPNYCRLFDKGLDALLGAFNLSDQLYLYINSTAIQFDYVLKLNEYLHFTIVFTGGQDAKLYVNGVLEETQTHSIASVGTNSTNFAIGANNALTGNIWDGHLSNARLFNTALTAAQVADLYNNPEKVVPTGVADSALKLWLPMQEGAGTTAYDGSGNGNHGTISGATWTHGIGAPVSQTAVIDWNKGTNLMVNSEKFDSSSWVRTNTNVTANDTTAPDGNQTADKIEFTATGAIIEDQFVNVASSLHIGSVFLKNDDIGSVQLEIIGGAPGILGQTTIDLTDGSLSASVGDYTPVATDEGNGWYKVSVGDTGSATVATPSLKIKRVGANGSFYAWGAQVQAADSLGPYVRTGATAQTSDVLLPQGLTSGRDITGVNLFENVRKQGALNLDGNSWAEVHDNASLDMTTTATMEAWANCDELVAAYQIIMVKSSDTYWTGNYGRYVLRANQNNVNWWFDDFTANTKYHSISLSGWNHLVVTKDGTTEKLYINGALVDTETGAATFTASPYSLVIGAQTSYAENWTKPIAQPRIYNRALTAEEVARNYDAGKNIYTND